MESIYLDNAATTPLDSLVLEAMMPYLQNKFGNPSSQYSYGRDAKLAIETARKKVASLLGVEPKEIYFTSGGTESNNTAIHAAVKDLLCTHIITSPIEHHAVLNTASHFARTQKIDLDLVRLSADGHIDLNDLNAKLRDSRHKCLVSLMHANNEIGNLTDIKKASAICKKHNAVFHTDCVQTVGHYPIDLSKFSVDLISASAHKFHGPKGVGILFVNKNATIKPLLYGGSQERNLRAGTENVYGIVGFARALEIAMENYAKDRAHISGLRIEFIRALQQHIPGLRFNGDVLGESLYTIVNISLPKTNRNEFLLLELDKRNICVSGGSACSTGTGASHVIKTFYPVGEDITLRFSFSRLNTLQDVQQVIAVLRELVE